jgi:hypothetical protein
MTLELPAGAARQLRRLSREDHPVAHLDDPPKLNVDFVATSNLEG